MFHAQHVFSWLSAHCIGEISRNLGKYWAMPFSFSVALQVATPDGRHSFHDVSRRIWCCGEWASESFCESCETMWSSHPPMPREVFLPGWDIAHWQCCVMILEGNAWWRSSFQNHPSIWYVYTPWKTHWCTIMYNKMHTCLDNWTPDQLPCP